MPNKTDYKKICMNAVLNALTEGLTPTERGVIHFLYGYAPKLAIGDAFDIIETLLANKKITRVDL